MMALTHYVHCQCSIQGSHAVLKKYWIVKSVQDLEKVLNLAKMHIKYWKKIDFRNSTIWIFKFCSSMMIVFEMFSLLCSISKIFKKWSYRVTQKDVYPWKFQLWLWLKSYLFQITATHYSVYGRPFTRVSTISVDL